MTDTRKKSDDKKPKQTGDDLIASPAMPVTVDPPADQGILTYSEPTEPNLPEDEDKKPAPKKRPSTRPKKSSK